MMHRMLRLICVSASAVALAGCTPPTIEVLVQDKDGRKFVTLAQDWGIITSDEQIPCIDRVELKAPQTDGEAIWRIDAATKECIELQSFTLGIIPEGFIETVSLSPNAQGKFKLVVWGVGIGEAELILP